MSSPAGETPEPSVQLASRSDVGQVREANEDSCGTFDRDDGTRLLVVADGMGGHRGGATASKVAIDTIAEIFDDKASTRAGAMLETAIETANARIFEQAQADPELAGMGTTVVAFHMDGKRRGTVAHVGDSRAYRYRKGRLEPITTDHSVVAEMQKRGLLSADEAAVHPRRNEILRSVGVQAEVEVEVSDVDILPGDRFVLCSDGLSGVVDDDEIAAVVQGESPIEAVDSLIRLANERGGPDNITVQVLAIPADESLGDPEATAPVELSAVGIEAIEKKRRERRRSRQVAAIVVTTVALGAAWFAWRSLGGANSPPAARTRSIPSKAAPSKIPVVRPEAGNAGTAAGVDSSEAAPTRAPEAQDATAPDRFEVDAPTPRRGVPREGASR